MNYSAVSDYGKEDARYVQRAVTNRNIGKMTFSPEDEVLDVGCGTGEETKVIATQVRSVTGIDPSEEMINFACQNNSAPNVSYYVDRAESVGDNPELKRRFNKAVSLFVLHWIPEEMKAPALKNILTCLKPGGQALFIAINRSSTTSDAHLFIRNHARWGKYVKGYEYPLHVWNRSVEESVALMTSCGWTNVVVELQTITTLMSKVRTKLYFKTTAIGQTALIPESEQDEFLDELWRWALARYEEKREPGNVVFPKEIVVIHANKPL